MLNDRPWAGHTLEWHVAGHHSRALNEQDINALPEALQALLRRGPTTLPVELTGQTTRSGDPLSLPLPERMFTLHAQLGTHHLLAQAPTLLELGPYADVITRLGLSPWTHDMG